MLFHFPGLISFQRGRIFSSINFVSVILWTALGLLEADFDLGQNSFMIIQNGTPPIEFGGYGIVISVSSVNTYRTYCSVAFSA